jgi:hypothetical protein
MEGIAKWLGRLRAEVRAEDPFEACCDSVLDQLNGCIARIEELAVFKPKTRRT